MKKLFLMLLAAVTLVACDKGGDDTSPKSIIVPNQQQLTQNVYADDNAGKSDVTFTTTGAWTSEIKESTTAKSTRAAADWISISPASGEKAGNHTIQISLQTNYTGEKRSATVSLKCSGEMVDIVVTQEAVTSTGEEPKPEKPEPSGEGLLTNETTGQSVKLTKALHLIQDFDHVQIEFFGEKQYEDESGKKSVWFSILFANPLENGRLKAGTYKVNFSGYSPHPNLKHGECYFNKSEIYYFYSGTIKVEVDKNTYKFTFDGIEDNTRQVIKGSFTGVPDFVSEEVKVSNISLSETQKTLEFGGSFTLSATILPENATDKRIKWSSSNTDIATVDGNGVVKAVAAGNATITATSNEGGKTATCAVTVNSAVAVTGITVDPTEVTLLEGESLEFYMDNKVTVLPKNATNKNFTFKLSNENVVTYTGKEIEAKTAGVATITFTTEDGAKTATLKVTVNKRPTSGSGTITRVDPTGKYETATYTIIRVDHTVLSKNCVELSLVNSLGNVVGKSKFNNPLVNGRLAAGTYNCAYPANDANNTYSNISPYEWMGSRTGTITIGVTGDQYTIGVNMAGEGSFTFTGNYSGSLTYTNEYVDVTSVTLNKTTLSLTIGDNYQLNATINPANAFNKNMTWSTSNSNIVAVNESNDKMSVSGYAKSVGTTTITVTTEDGAKTATCQVTVNALPSTGNGTFSNNHSQSLSISRAEQWVNEKDPKEIEIRLAKPNSAHGNLTFTLVRGASDTGTLKSGTYTSIRNLMADDLGIKHSSENTGSVTVALSGDNYTVTLDVTSSDGTKITGTYTGKIPKA